MAPFFRNGGRQVVPPSLIDHLYYSNSPAPLPNLDSNTIRLSDEAIARMMVQIYKDTWDLDTLVQSDVLKETQAIFTKAVDQGTPPSTPHRTAFKRQLTTSTDVFSAFRVHTQAQHMASLMVDAQGNRLAFDDWAERVQPYVNHQNRAWLRTEFDTAAIRAHNEADWQRFREDADVYPYLEWIPSTSDKPGEDHKVFWGTVLPVSDPFWKEHHPGDRWNCKCSLQQTDRTPTPQRNGHKKCCPARTNVPARQRRNLFLRPRLLPQGLSHLSLQQRHPTSPIPNLPTKELQHLSPLLPHKTLDTFRSWELYFSEGG